MCFVVLGYNPDYLRQWRMLYGLSQEDAGAQLGVRRETIQAWEARKRDCPYLLGHVLSALAWGLKSWTPLRGEHYKERLLHPRRGYDAAHKMKGRHL